MRLLLPLAIAVGLCASARAQTTTLLLAADDDVVWNDATLRQRVVNEAFPTIANAARNRGWRAFDVAGAFAETSLPAPEWCDVFCRDSLAIRLGAAWIVECGERTVQDSAYLTCTAREPGRLAPTEGVALPTYVSPPTVAQSLWQAMNASSAPKWSVIPRRWLHLRAGLSDAAIRIDGVPACQGGCSVLLNEGRHALHVDAPPFASEDRIVDVDTDSSVDFALASRTGVLDLTTTRAATLRIGEIVLRLEGGGSSTVRVFAGDVQVTVEDPCHHLESWPVTVAGGSRQRVEVRPSPYFGLAHLEANSSSGRDVDAEAEIDGERTVSLPYDGELPLCARVEVKAPFHESDTVRRSGPADAVWKPNIRLREKRERDRGRLAARPHGFSLRTGIAGLNVTEVSALNFADGDFLFPALGITARSFAREAGGREGGLGVTAELWGSAHFAGVFARSSLVYLPQGGLPGFGDARSPGASPMAFSIGFGAAAFFRAGPLVLGLSPAYDLVPGRLEGGPSVLFFAVY